MGAGLITAEIIVGGLGRHSYYLQPSQRRLFVALGWSDWIQTFITLMFTKISICLFLLRIVDGRKVRMAMHTLIGCLVLFTTVFTCLFLGICRPLKAYWNIGVESVCLSDKVVENILIAQGGSKALWKADAQREAADSTWQFFRSSPISSARPFRSSSLRGQSFPLSDLENGNSKIRSESDHTFDTGASLELGIAGISKDSDEGSKEKNGTLWLPDKD
ncbi:MAG: hypothetical protein Q9208_006492 [Pyrenodesmia sp. 3 TL-2023]